jgi:hypothetical protein
VRKAVLLLLLLVACVERKPDPAPPSDTTPPDTTVVDSMLIIDSVGGQGGDSLDYEYEESELQPSDTLITAEDSAQRARRLRSAAPDGIALGLNKWPTDQWCSGKLTGAVAAFSPAIAGGVVRKAEFCGIRIIPAAPRNQMSHNGQADGYFDLARAKRYCTALSSALGNLKSSSNIGFAMIGDELHSTTWAGRIAKNTEVAEYARHCRDLLDPIPIMLRTPPNLSWVTNLSASQWSGVDYFAATYKKGRGNRRLNGNWAAQQRDYYDKMEASANRIGKHVALLVNFSNCSTERSGQPCTPAEVELFAKGIYEHPARSCVTSWWKYDRTFSRAEYQDAFKRAVVDGRLWAISYSTRTSVRE